MAIPTIPAGWLGIKHPVPCALPSPAFRNNFSEQRDGKGQPPRAVAECDEAAMVGNAARLGNMEILPVVARATSGIIRNISSAADLVPRIVAEAEQTARGGKAFYRPS